ncbi:hypothetical protein OUZ56_011472 [Daphnia magna]|uniref:Uncharacterized protein n=1 Tax=Daphnia magna TaxID=35525 RepID=A0ABQ9Z0L5_9CRUS|nr:hypothetical protein OUZ56_011472 [Daphnia magna]
MVNAVEYEHCWHLYIYLHGLSAVLGIDHQMAIDDLDLDPTKFLIEMIEIDRDSFLIESISISINFQKQFISGLLHNDLLTDSGSRRHLV